MYINSPGGVVTAGLAIHDTMNYIRPDVATVCIGQAASMGSFLLAAGAKGKRVALTNSRIMIHQPSGGAQGMASDIEIQAKEILRMRHRLNTLYADYTGKTVEEIERAMDRDNFLEADEALAFGWSTRSWRSGPLSAKRRDRDCPGERRGDRSGHFDVARSVLDCNMIRRPCAGPPLGSDLDDQTQRQRLEEHALLFVLRKIAA